MLLGRELGDERGGYRVVGAYEHADEEARRHELERVGAEHAQDGEGSDGHDVDDEHLLAPDAVGEVAARDRAHEDAQQNRRPRWPRSTLVEVEQRCDLRERHADEREHVPSKNEPADSRRT